MTKCTALHSLISVRNVLWSLSACLDFSQRKMCKGKNKTPLSFKHQHFYLFHEQVIKIKPIWTGKSVQISTLDGRDHTVKGRTAERSQLQKILKEMGIPDHLNCLLRNMYVGQEETELDMKQLTGSKLAKEYHKAVYCHPAYLTSMQSTSCEMLGWMNNKPESRLPGEIQR